MRKHRSRKRSHFVEEDVSMKALNDPLPPHHPASPEPQPSKNGSKFRFYDIDLSNLASARGPQVPHRPSEPGSSYKAAAQSTSRHQDLDEYEDLPLRFKLSHGKTLFNKMYKFQIYLSLRG